jgi:hypothetical protein
MRKVRLLIAIPMLFTFVSTSSARPAYYAIFKKEYLDMHKDKKFAETVDKTEGGGKCLICHQGKKKDNRNAFGKELSKLITKKDQKNTEKISASIKKVLAMKVDPKDKKSKTYMDRLKASEWPGGKLEDLKKEPKMSKEKAAEEAKKE